MTDRLDDDQLMIGYLLGQLSEDEQTQVEDRFLRDPEYLDRLKALEQDLNDEYARGEMTVQERQQLETRMAASPEWRRRTIFAKALMTLDGESAPLAETSRNSPGNSFLAVIMASLRSPSPAVSFSLAAAFVIALGSCVWLLLETSRLRSQIADLSARQAETEQREGEQRQKAADERTRSDNLARELESERRRLGQLEMQGSNSLAPSILSFILTPGVSRGSGESARLLIASGTKQIRLQPYLEGAPDYHKYRAELRTIADRIVLTKDNLVAKQTRLGKSLFLIVPASLLSDGDYEVVVSGIAGSSRSEHVGSYYFSVARR